MYVLGVLRGVHLIVEASPGVVAIVSANETEARGFISHQGPML
jgi:hypothetical protein